MQLRSILLGNTPRQSAPFREGVDPERIIGFDLNRFEYPPSTSIEICNRRFRLYETNSNGFHALWVNECGRAVAVQEFEADNTIFSINNVLRLIERIEGLSRSMWCSALDVYGMTNLNKIRTIEINNIVNPELIKAIIDGSHILNHRPNPLIGILDSCCQKLWGVPVDLTSVSLLIYYILNRHDDGYTERYEPDNTISVESNNENIDSTDSFDKILSARKRYTHTFLGTYPLLRIPKKSITKNNKGYIALFDPNPSWCISLIARRNNL